MKEVEKKNNETANDKKMNAFSDENSNLFVYPKWDTDEWLMGSKCQNVTPSKLCPMKHGRTHLKTVEIYLDDRKLDDVLDACYITFAL